MSCIYPALLLQPGTLSTGSVVPWTNHALSGVLKWRKRQCSLDSIRKLIQQRQMRSPRGKTRPARHQHQHNPATHSLCGQISYLKLGTCTQALVSC
ncbi:hypothetical protein BD289DRAFT_428278 [Coniella lustricola]|uniref:Uncharacterized protein n=1 Tax=Coniella lustricola TaxID=2025994 RepID=A0A2T3AE67_9PEZI|nr:hypothetical protein BD289DRAFT_428278 [Coniella lustricola]